MNKNGKARLSLLLAEDERNTREALYKFLRARFDVTMAEDGITALNLLSRNHYELVLTDLKMPGADGMQVLETALKQEPKPVCLVFSAYGGIEDAVRAVKLGAFDFVVKPVKLDELELKLDRALEAHSLREENRQLREKLGGPGPEAVVAQSQAMKEVLETIRQVAPTRSTVLITGESGTGKEVAARLLHKLSGRDGKFVAVHCAALASNLLESELFGHEKGAFTGATETRKGRFELAQDGTLFLDEIGEIDAAVQVKLLRVLENRSFERVGGEEELYCDARLLAATNRDLAEMVREGTFREDLFYRLDVVNIKMPPLRERTEDIPILVQRFIEQFALENRKPVTGISEEAMDCLMVYRWPGNIRELRNTVERMVVLSRGEILGEDNIPPAIRRSAGPETLPLAARQDRLDLEHNERYLIQKALEECGGNRTRAAEKLGISRRTLHRKLKDQAIC